MKIQSVFLLFLMGLLYMSSTVHGWRSEHCGPDKLPFDPDKRGCCNELQPDGTYKWVRTDDPKNEPDPCSKVPSDGAYGARICYNGNMYTCYYPSNMPASWRNNSAIVDCINRHEKLHETQSGTYCPKCTGKARHTDAAFRSNECAAYQASVDCLRGLSWTIEIGDLIAEINLHMDSYELKCFEIN